MKLSIDPALCQGHLRCMDLVPELFDADDLGHGVVRQEVVANSQQDAARVALMSCPEGAIVVQDD